MNYEQELLDRPQKNTCLGKVFFLAFLLLLMISSSSVKIFDFLSADWKLKNFYYGVLHNVKFMMVIGQTNYDYLFVNLV